MKKIPLTPKDVESIEAMAGFGMPTRQIAHVLGMSKATLERRMNDSPPELDAMNALKRGRAKAAAEVTQTAFNLAKGGREPGMTQFWLQCRANWKRAGETVKVEHTGKNGAPIATTNETDEEKQARHERVQARLAKLKALDE